MMEPEMTSPLTAAGRLNEKEKGCFLALATEPAAGGAEPRRHRCRGRGFLLIPIPPGRAAAPVGEVWM